MSPPHCLLYGKSAALKVFLVGEPREQIPSPYKYRGLKRPRRAVILERRPVMSKVKYDPFRTFCPLY